MLGICIFIYLRPTYTDYSLDYSRLMALDKLIINVYSTHILKTQEWRLQNSTLSVAFS